MFVRFRRVQQLAGIRGAHLAGGSLCRPLGRSGRRVVFQLCPFDDATVVRRVGSNEPDQVPMRGINTNSILVAQQFKLTIWLEPADGVRRNTTTPPQ